MCTGWVESWNKFEFANFMAQGGDEEEKSFRSKVFQFSSTVSSSSTEIVSTWRRKSWLVGANFQLLSQRKMVFREKFMFCLVSWGGSSSPPTRREHSWNLCETLSYQKKKVGNSELYFFFSSSIVCKQRWARRDTLKMKNSFSYHRAAKRWRENQVGICAVRWFQTFSHKSSNIHFSYFSLSRSRKYLLKMFSAAAHTARKR